MKKIMVLNDGETYSSLDGCFIATVPEDLDDELIEEWLRNMRDTHSTWWIDLETTSKIERTLLARRVKDALTEGSSLSVVTVFQDV